MKFVSEQRMRTVSADPSRASFFFFCFFPTKNLARFSRITAVSESQRLADTLTCT